jgi:tRNA 2-thiouridine synthesizing protein A
MSPHSKHQTAREQTAEMLIQDMEALRGSLCRSCGEPFCHHEALMSIAMGFKSAPYCLRCLAQSLEREPRSLTDSLLGYIQQRECHRTAWKWAGTTEGTESSDLPACVARRLESAGQSNSPRSELPLAAAAHAEESALQPDLEWDAGDMGCGDLVLELRLRLQSMAPGTLIQLHARDPGAPEDLPAWCRLTGHRLLRAQHPNYWIQRKE